jgi:hypothetical protein
VKVRSGILGCGSQNERPLCLTAFSSIITHPRSLNKTRALGPILQVLDNIPFLQRDCLTEELTLVVRVTGK